jgi:hypothetical protein
MTAMDLTAEVTAVDEHLTVEWVNGVCVLHGPKNRALLSASSEVKAMRIIRDYTPQFVVHHDLEESK